MPTVIPPPDKSQIVHGIKDACADDVLWLVSSVVQYIKETGELGFADEVITYADGGEGTVYEHMRRILDFSARQIGRNGICKGLNAPPATPSPTTASASSRGSTPASKRTARYSATRTRGRGAPRLFWGAEAAQ